MKKITNAVKEIGKYAATKSVNSASFCFFHQEKEAKDVKAALTKKVR